MNAGGGFQFVTLASMLKKRLEAFPATTTSPFPLALVFDSMPGIGDLSGAHAFSVSVRNPILRFAVFLVAWLTIALVIVLFAIFRKASPFIAMRAHLASPDVFPGSNHLTRRLYAYSNADVMVPHAYVEEHLDELRARLHEESKKHGDTDGAWETAIRVRNYGDSKHVAHAKTYPAAYWAAVQEVWDDAVRLAAITAQK